MLRPITLSLLGTLAFTGAARADLPEVAFGPIFERVCGELRVSTSCDDCECAPLTSSIGDTGHDTPYAILVKLQSKPDTEPFKTRYHLVVGSDTQLSNAGVIHKAKTSENVVPYLDVVVHKAETFEDICLKCDHENVGLVHLFDVTLKQTDAGQDEQYHMLETHADARLLFTCFGAPMACYGTPLSMSQRTDRMPMAPGDKGKKGKAQTWARTWKIGGRNKMQIVLGPVTGNAAKDVKELFASESREFNFGDIPTRATTTRAP